MFYLTVLWTMWLVLAIFFGIAGVFLFISAYLPIWERRRSPEDQIDSSDPWTSVLKHIPLFLYFTYFVAIAAFIVVLILFMIDPPQTW